MDATQSDAPAAPPAGRRGVVRIILIAIALVGLAAILRSITSSLVIGFGGIVLATVLLAVAIPLGRRTGWKHRWNLLVVIAGLLGAGVVLSWFFGNEVAHEFRQLQQQLPEAAQKLEAWLNGSPAGRAAVDAVTQSGANTEVLSRVSKGVAALMGATGNLLLIVFLGIYFAADPTLYRDGMVRLIPPSRRAQVKRALDDTGEALRKWVAAQALTMLAVGVLTGVALALLKVPLALSLGVLAGLLEFIPVIGPVLSAVPGVLLAFSQGPQMAFYVALVYVGVQQIESNVLTPLIQRWAVQLPPVIGLLAIVVCGELFGVLGVVFAMPMAVAVMTLVRDLYIEDTLERPRADPVKRVRERTAGDEPRRISRSG